MSIVLLIAMVVLYAVGFMLMLERGLTRILLGFLLVGNATNLLLFFSSWQLGKAPLVDKNSDETLSDPLPQAFILTAIVITFAVSAFVLALIYRSFRLAGGGDDSVGDDAEDLEIARGHGAASEAVSDADFDEVSDFDADADGVDDRIQHAQNQATEKLAGGAV